MTWDSLSTKLKKPTCSQLTNISRFESPLPAFRLSISSSSSMERFYLIGSDRKKRYFPVLKIDRVEPYDLSISEDPVAYPLQDQEPAPADC